MTEIQLSQYVRHTRKPEWGIGELVESDGGRHRFAFQDGQMRVFMAAGLEFLTVVTPSDEDMVGMKARAKVRHDDGKSTKKPRVTEAPVGTIERQVDVFTSLFPAGFGNEKYITAIRCVPTPKATGKHVVLALAQQTLAVEPLQTLLGKKGVGVLALLKKIASKSRGLALPEDLAVLTALAADPTGVDEQALTEAIFSLLHGTEPLAERADAFLAALPVQARKWSLLGLLPAIYSPIDRAPVIPAITIRQATIIGAQLASRDTPNGADYALLFDILRDVKTRIEEMFQTPADLLDVFLFAEISLAPNAAKKASAAKKKDSVPDSSRARTLPVVVAATGPRAHSGEALVGVGLAHRVG